MTAALLLVQVGNARGGIMSYTNSMKAKVQSVRPPQPSNSTCAVKMPVYAMPFAPQHLCLVSVPPLDHTNFATFVTKMAGGRQTMDSPSLIKVTARMPFRWVQNPLELLSQHAQAWLAGVKVAG